MSRGAAVEDASRGGRTDGVGLSADHRENGSASAWQADRGFTSWLPGYSEEYTETNAFIKAFFIRVYLLVVPAEPNLIPSHFKNVVMVRFVWISYMFPVIAQPSATNPVIVAMLRAHL
jgi:hypothetical protein